MMILDYGSPMKVACRVIADRKRELVEAKSICREPDILIQDIRMDQAAEDIARLKELTLAICKKIKSMDR